MSETKLPPLTEFQKAILWALERAPNNTLSTWDIAQTAFAEEWKKRSARAAYIGHIDRASMKMPDFVGRIPPKDRFCHAKIFLRNQHH